MIGRPAARWRILIVDDFILVPRPAARMTTSSWLLFMKSPECKIRYRESILRTLAHALERPAVAVVEAKDIVRQRRMVMANEVSLGDDVAEEGRHPEVAYSLDVELYGKLILRRVALENGFDRPAAIHHHDIDDQAGVLDDRGEMLFGAIAIGLARLRHHIAY